MVCDIYSEDLEWKEGTLRLKGSNYNTGTKSIITTLCIQNRALYFTSLFLPEWTSLCATFT